MVSHQQALLLLAVIAVGVFHTAVPDHWVPIAVVARSKRWSSAVTARTAALAGLGHTVSTLLIGVLVWGAGVAFAARFGRDVSIVASLALVGFGLWFVIASLREIKEGSHEDHGHEGEIAQGARWSLLLILGSSPMVEGIPAFFAASRYGVGLLAAMSVLFALSSIGTYVVLCVQSARALERLSFGPLERYGEVLSGAVIAIVGVASLFFM